MENKEKYKYRIRIVLTQSGCEIPVLEIQCDDGEWSSIRGSVTIEEAKEILERIKKGELDFKGRPTSNGVIYECEI